MKEDRQAGKENLEMKADMEKDRKTDEWPGDEKQVDSTKVGQLILQLRNEKGMTQQQLADRLHISNKAVSKWECGMGCPDTSLWPGLASVLGVDIQKMLQGGLDPNGPDIGKIQNIRFYVCSSCGNILVSTGQASVSCCGRKLQPLVCSSEKSAHEITVKETDGEYYIAIQHEMRKDHYISFVAYVKNDRILLVRLYPEQDAAVRVPVMGKGGDLYVYCTKHGLQKAAFSCYKPA